MPNLENCVAAYQQLIDQKINFRVALFDGKEIQNIHISFGDGEFKHLAGLHKLKDIFSNQISGEFILGNVPTTYTSASLLNSQYLIDDTGKTEDEKKALCQEPSNKNKVLKSNLRERMKALEELDKTFLGVENGDVILKVYHWHKGEMEEDKWKRPNNSKISADYLFEFQSTSNDDFICLFIENGAATAFGKSIFTETETRSEDNQENAAQQQKHHKLPRTELQYEILSLIRTERGQPSNSLIACSPERMQECQEIHNNTVERIKQKEAKKPFVDNKKKIIKARRGFLQSENKNDYNAKKALYNYTCQFEHYSDNERKYSNEYLDYLIQELTSNLSDSSNSNEHHCIVFELDMTLLAKMDRELVSLREDFVRNIEGSYIEKADSFIAKANEGYEEYAIAILQRQKSIYNTPEKKKQFNEEEIFDINKWIDDEISRIQTGRGRGNGKNEPSDKKKISPLVEKPSKIQTITQTSYNKLSNLKQYISDSISELKEYIGFIKEQFPEFVESAKQVLHTIADNIRSPIRFPDEEKTDGKSFPKVFSFEAKDCVGIYDSICFASAAPTFTLELNGIMSSGIYEYSFPLSEMIKGKSETVKPIASKTTEQTRILSVEREVPQRNSKSAADKPKKKKSQFEYGD